MSDIIKGSEFNYHIDTEYGINHDGFIAAGTESIVFKGVRRGEEKELRYSCALKFKPKSRLKDFMEREYSILESMQTCRSVVRVLDVIEDLGDFSIPYGRIKISRENCFCVVEEYIDGYSLQDYCINQWFVYNKEKRKWTRNSTEYEYREIVKFQNQIIQFMINLCEIMKFVSNVNANNDRSNWNKPVVLHCDIKPENIMVTKHGKELVLIDFGRSQRIEDGCDYQHCNNSDGTFYADYGEEQWQDVGKDNFYTYGTVGYSAPECYAQQSEEVHSKGKFPFENQKNAIKCGLISVESDIFGFGATFWECISMYETGMQILENASDTSSPRFFNKALQKKYEEDIHNNDKIADYCDRNFRGINKAYHEALESVLQKCMHIREKDFRIPKEKDDDYYHNFFVLQNDIEKARDIIPSLDRKSDPLVKQMVGISGFCSALTVMFFVIWILLTIFSNWIALEKWENLKQNYTDNQKTSLSNIAQEMLNVPIEKNRYDNFEKVLAFTYGGNTNDDTIDQEEAEILITLIKDNISDESLWGKYLDIIMKNAKSDNLDEISKSVYRIDLSEEFHSDGYLLAKAIAQINDADDGDGEKLKSAYDIMNIYKDSNDYQKSVSKIAAKLLTGKKIETIAAENFTDRESIRSELKKLA